MLTSGSGWEEKTIWVLVDVILAWNQVPSPSGEFLKRECESLTIRKMAKIALLSADYNDNVTMIMAGVLWGTGHARRLRLDVVVSPYM